jgi:stage II sporulation protein D
VLRPRAGAAVVADGRRYRGEALVRAGPPGRVTVVNVLELEAYLRGVVPAEIGHRTRAELEAVKAQAVAARTYAVGRLGRATDFDLYAGTRDQVYAGLAGEDSLGNLAVAQTRGQIVTYRGQPIMAYYHSTCGGRTASIQGAWPWRPPQPYLRSVSDEKPGGGAYCDIAPRYRWRTTWTLAQLRDALTNALAALSGGAVREVQDIEELRILSRTPSGRVGSLRLRVDGTSYLLRGDSVRYVLRTPAGALLNSALLLEMTTHAPDDSLALEVEGGGWGHGVGMCQWGAIGRARAGQRYDRILATYYQGTQLTRLY